MDAGRKPAEPLTGRELEEALGYPLTGQVAEVSGPTNLYYGPVPT